MKYKLHYAPLELDGDIELKEFKTWNDRLNFISDKVIIDDLDKVFILAINYSNDESADSVYVFDKWHCIRFMDNERFNSINYTFHLHEYSSYEEAYDVALDMKETNKLCYEK